MMIIIIIIIIKIIIKIKIIKIRIIELLHNLVKARIGLFRSP